VVELADAAEDLSRKRILSHPLVVNIIEKRITLLGNINICQNNEKL